ncbi:ABC transporter permease [Streptomyces sp. 7-21]|uniref:ABC transporter permease n=1 Tax=Streptomyces sp. 7-21 TaxID=2802283 RepID=UPI00191D1A46|nr:ABC transporter permease [Streptomyces sp. 7-21]MBL1065265.1 ABC transporter permease [Streptomyces sp. 7-21]
MSGTKAAPGTLTPQPPPGKQRRPRGGPQRSRGGRRSALLLNLAALVLGVCVWAVLAWLDVQGLPGPAAVLAEAGELAGDGTLAEDILASVRRVLTGFALGSLAAVAAGFLMGWYPLARGLLEPYVQFFRTIPPLALIPLTIVLLGIGETPKITVIFLAAFLSCVVATLQGVLGVDRTLINAARVLGAGDRTIFLKVIVPYSAPFILVGMRIGLGASWSTLVAAELIAAQEGLGYRMQQAQIYYDLPTIFVGLLTIGVLGLAMDRVLLLAERRLTRWQERR